MICHCFCNLLLVPSPQFVYKFYVLFYNMFRLFMDIIRQNIYALYFVYCFALTLANVYYGEDNV
jgi:hypothetical protein